MLDGVIKGITTIVNFIVALFKIIGWWIMGVVDLGEMFVQAMPIFTDIFSFFPVAVASALIAVCGGLLALRIFGRS